MRNLKNPKNLSLGIALRECIPLIFKQSRTATCFKAVFVLFSGFVGGAMMPAMELLFTGMVGQDVGGDAPRLPILFAVGLVLLITMLNGLMGMVSPVVDVYRQGRTRGGLTQLIHDKMAHIPAQRFEDKEALDDITKAKEGMEGAMGLMDMVINIVCYHGMYFAVVGVFLWRLEPILVLSLAFVFIPVALSQIIHARIHAAQQNKLAPVRREETQYYRHALNHEDTRFYGLFNCFHAKMLEARKRLFDTEWRTEIRVQRITFGLNLVKILGWVGILVLLFRGMIGGSISVGAFAAVFTAIGTMFGNMENVFRSIQYEAMNRLGAIHHFLHFLSMADQESMDNTHESETGAVSVTASGISFNYPAAERPAVDNVSLHIAPGETVAIVGVNGSGKTTLVKLLCGLYRPSAGTVCFGANNKPPSFARTSAVFQDFARYTPLSLADNVNIACWDDPPDGIVPSLEAAEVEHNDKATFPNGVDTILSRNVDGVQLSGGQWQRIAMARGLFRSHELIILDEPTAAIDPVEESRVYRQFAELAKDKTAILVTHRLGSARIADRIVVMDNACVVEIGTHETLLDAGGLYANMWQMQAGGYYENRENG